MFYAGGYVPPSPDIAPEQRHVTNTSTHSPIVDVNEANFAAEVEQSSLPVFIDFWAPWCGPCKGLEPTFKQLAETYREQIKFVKVNADDNAALMKRFKVRGLPTLLLLRDGQVVEKAGVPTKSALANLLDKHVQQPVALKAAPQRSFRAFHGDAAVRESVVTRLRERIQRMRIVQQAHEQRYGLMSGALHDEGFEGLLAFENALGIPGQVGQLQETVHGFLLQEHEIDGFKVKGLQPPHDVWPLDWWLAIPPGADLQLLPSHFIAWLLLDRSAEIYPYAVSEDARGVMASLANLHARYARGDAPTDAQWRAVRNAAGDLVKREKPAGQEADEGTPQTTLMSIEILAWPVHELDHALAQAVNWLHSVVSERAVRAAYTAEQWAEREAPRKTHQEEMDRLVKWYGDKNVSKIEDTEALSAQDRKALEERKEALEEALRRMIAAGDSRKAFEDPLSGKAKLAYAERLHVGLMLALKDTVAGA
jgi:thioredoxin